MSSQPSTGATASVVIAIPAVLGEAWLRGCKKNATSFQLACTKKNLTIFVFFFKKTEKGGWWRLDSRAQISFVKSPESANLEIICLQCTGIPHTRPFPARAMICGDKTAWQSISFQTPHPMHSHHLYLNPRPALHPHLFRPPSLLLSTRFFLTKFASNSISKCRNTDRLLL